MFIIDAHEAADCNKKEEGKSFRSLSGASAFLPAADESVPPGKPARRILRPSSKGETLATRFRCPCCGCKTLEAPGALALCPVCWWEDDGQEDSDAAQVRLTVNGALSLNEARENYSRCGAAHYRFLPYVRKPQIAEQE